SMMPPGLPCSGLPRVWRFAMFTFSTTTRSRSGSTRSTTPRLPLSFPAMTTTSSPFLIRFITVFLCLSPRPGGRASPRGSLQDFRSERDDLHESFAAQFARHRPEDAGADGLHLVVEQ